jgi:hypothetical protein
MKLCDKLACGYQLLTSIAKEETGKTNREVAT